MKSFRQMFIKPWLYLAVIAIGLFFKFYHIEHKLFWRDEIASVLYASGVKDSEYINNIPANEIISIEYFYSVLHNADNPYTTKQKIKGILSDTHLTPFHYILLSVWYHVIGENVMDYRLLSVLIFMLSLPFLFLLAKTLFNSNIGGWITTSLYAVSPFINCQSQEARYYIVWIFFFILSNCYFLLAVKHQKAVWWIAYAITSIFALYTSILSATFILGHLAYIIICQRHLLMKVIITQVLLLAAYMPWLFFLYSVRNIIQSGMAWHHIHAKPSLYSLELIFFQLIGWARSFTYFSDFSYFFDLYLGNFQSELYFGLFVDVIVLCMIFYSITHLFRKSSKNVRWFLISIILPLFLFFYLSDVIRHGFTSLFWRYQVINMVGVTLVVANLLTSKIKGGSPLFAGLYCGLIMLGIISTARISQERCWNTSPDCPSIINVAQVIAQASYPLIVTDLGGFDEYGFHNFLSIINESKSKNADILYLKGNIPDMRTILAGKPYSEIFVMQASEEFINALKQQLGDNFMLYRKEDNSFYPQIIWRIKL